MTNTKYLLLIILFLAALTTRGQNEPRFSHFMYAQQFYNPAYTGSNNSWGLTLISRQQWKDFENHPETNALGLDMPFNNRKFGLGLTLSSDHVGTLNRKAVFINYAYAIKLPRQSFFRMGISGGVTSYRHNFGQMSINDPGDPVFQVDTDNIWLPNFGLGFYYHSKNTCIGLSAPRLLLNETGTHKNTPGLNQLLFSSSTRITVANGLDIMPALLTTYNPTDKFVAGINLSLRLANRISAGASYYTTDKLNIGLNAMVWIDPNFKIGYAYETNNFNSITQQNNGTHELIIAITFNYQSTHFTSPRMF